MGVIGSRLAWVAVGMALVGTMVRWYESYLIGADIGPHPGEQPVRSVRLFCWLTTLSTCTSKTSLHARAGRIRDAGGERGGRLPACTRWREAHEIQPLVPALKSWWMKLHAGQLHRLRHLPLSAMVAFAYLIKHQAGETRWYKLAPLWLLGWCCASCPWCSASRAEAGGSYWAVYFGSRP